MERTSFHYNAFYTKLFGLLGRKGDFSRSSAFGVFVLVLVFAFGVFVFMLAVFVGFAVFMLMLVSAFMVVTMVAAT